MYKKIMLLACIIFVSLAGSVFATATSSVWQGSESGDWATASNWGNSIVPTALDPPGGPQANPYSIAQFSSTHTSPGLTAGVTVACDLLRIGDISGQIGVLSVNGGTMNISELVYMSYLSTENSTLTMNSGTINCGVRIPASGKFYAGYKGQGTLNMNGGTINLTTFLSIADQAGSTGYIHLDGGTIYATDLLMNTANAHLDIRNGTLILDGNDLAAINGFVSSGKLTAYAGSPGGTVLRDYNVTNIGKTTVTGYLASPKAINPSPFNGAPNILVNTTLSWTAGLGAASHDVYLDTVNPPVAFQGNRIDPNFTPTALAPATTYYWRIDEVNGPSTVTGDIWSFSTISGLPTGPNPANAAQGVAIHPILSWTGGQGASSHDVYFGTTNPPASQGNQAGTTFDPGNLLPNFTYYWQIKEVYPAATIAGPVWSFATPNTKAKMSSSQYCPPHGITGMPINGIILTWTAGVGAVSHDVYLGSTSPGTFQGNQPGTSFAIPTNLTPNTKYYWRIDEKDGSGGTTTGDVNDFTTGDPVVISPYLTWRNDPTNSIMVNWWNPAAKGDSSVDYGLTDSYGSTVNLPALVNYHHVELTGLATGTLYHYRIRSSDGTTGSDSTFKTAPDPNTDSFKFAFSGDPRGTTIEDEPYYTRQKALCDWVLARDYDFAIEGGDTVWAGASLKAIGKWWPDFFRLQGNLSKSKVVMHALGNHEVQEGSYYYWNDFYVDAHPTNGPVGSVGGGRAYSFDYGNAHFVSPASYQVNVDVAQKAWLIADLTAAKARGAKWIFVYLHAPMFTSSGHPNRVDCIQHWGPIFDQFGVNVVFQSHNHLYERFKPLVTYYDDVTNPASPVWTGRVVPDGEGVIYTTNGLGGAEYNNGGTDPKLVCWFGTSNLGATVVTSVTVNGDIATIEAIRNDTGAVIDTYTVTPRMRKDDYNRDGITDIKDLGIFVGSWLDTGMWP